MHHSNNYQKEVISIPAGNSYPFVREHLVYACPNSGRFATYKSARYMTFRPKGGFMETLYGVSTVLILDPYSPDWSQVPDTYRERVEGYINQRMAEWHFSEHIFKFYVLSTTDQIELPHKPHADCNLRGHAYFTRDELLSGKQIVQVESKSSKDTPRDIENISSEPLPTISDWVTELEADEETDWEVSSSSETEDDVASGEWAFPEELEDHVSGKFDPDAIVNSREQVARLIVQRRGQPKFRQSLLRAYRSRCAITEYSVPHALEAAHITGYLGPESNHPANGLLLRGDIHTLFDLHLLTIDSETMSVVLSPKLMKSPYKYLHGKAISLPNDLSFRPSRKALDYHRKESGL